MSSNLETAGFDVKLMEYDPPKVTKVWYRSNGMEVRLSVEKPDKYYLSKGFLTQPPIQKELKLSKYKCPICHKPFDSISEMIGCLEVHNKEV